MTSVGLIGCGGIAQDVVAALREAGGVRAVGACCAARTRRGARRARRHRDRRNARRTAGTRPDVVAEVAGQQAVADHGEAVRRGIDLLVISVGALADPALLARLKAAAESRRGPHSPAGRRHRRHRCGRGDAGRGLTSVRYRSRKPPAAWRGSPAEQIVDLGSLTQTHRALPRHRRRGRCSNSRRTPMSRPRSRSPASASTPPRSNSSPIPTRPATSHEIEAEGAAGRFAIQLQGKPSRSNPRPRRSPP